MIMRTYLPAEDIVNQTWQPPKITPSAGKKYRAIWWLHVRFG